MAEVWKIIPTFKRFECTKDGLIRYKKTQTIRKTFVNKRSGYAFIVMTKGKKQITKYVHNLIARTWLGKRKPGQCIDHINCDKADNRISNLRYVSQSYNILKSYEEGRVYVFNSEEHPSDGYHFIRVISDDDIMVVKEMYDNGISQIKIAKKFGVSNSCISKNLKERF